MEKTKEKTKKKDTKIAPLTMPQFAIEMPGVLIGLYIFVH